jgi:hypothetical protein
MALAFDHNFTGKRPFPIHHFCHHQRPFPPNSSSFRKTYNSLWRCTSITFVLPDGRLPSNLCAIPNNFHNQPTAQNSKSLPQRGRFAETLSLLCQSVGMKRPFSPTNFFS